MGAFGVPRSATGCARDCRGARRDERVSPKKLSAADAARRHRELAQEVEDLAYRYYVLAQPTVADAEYDAKMRELEALETDFDELRTPDSPTQKVMESLSTDFAEVTHLERLLSLDNVFSDAEFDAWAARATREMPVPAWLCELKIDGL